MERKRGGPWQDRFWPKVHVAGPDECWPWMATSAGLRKCKYGRLKIKGSHVPAHHLAFEIKHGRRPTYVLHTCDNSLCCNPSHLLEGTHQENMSDCVRKGRKHTGPIASLIPEIRRRIAAGQGSTYIEREFELSLGTVSKIKAGTIYARF